MSPHPNYVKLHHQQKFIQGNWTKININTIICSLMSSAIIFQLLLLNIMAKAWKVPWMAAVAYHTCTSYLR